MKRNNVAFYFLYAALLSLILGLIFGLVGGLQYILPDFLKEALSFTRTRPLHVSLVITWIFTAAAGGVYYYIQLITGKKLWSEKLVWFHFVLFIITGTCIIFCYLTGRFGGREYFEFPPILSVPILVTWICFAINFFKTLKPGLKHAPVYVWMWSTGVIFFILTLIEQYLWMIPWFRDNMIRDITVQWKSMGAIVGSWNQLVYGTAFFIMAKISGNEKVAHSPLTFFFYFLGLTNLMFNWGHHTYIVPSSPYIKNIGYIVSMTELLILGNIMLNWKKTVSEAQKNFHHVPYRFLAAADIWIFLNLALAIAISIPAVNLYTHGTHITVAHAMGATIGINSMILFASLFFIAEQEGTLFESKKKRISTGFWIVNISLLVFWIALIGAGISKAVETLSQTPFSVMMQKLAPYFGAFTASGAGILLGITFITIPLAGFLFTRIRNKIHT